jgi:hypothetical protein
MSSAADPLSFLCGRKGNERRRRRAILLTVTSYKYHTPRRQCRVVTSGVRHRPEPRNVRVDIPCPSGITSAGGFSSKRILPDDHTVSPLVLRDAPGIQATSLTPSYLPLVTVQGRQKIDVRCMWGWSQGTGKVYEEGENDDARGSSFILARKQATMAYPVLASEGVGDLRNLLH